MVKCLIANTHEHKEYYIVLQIVIVLCFVLVLNFIYFN